jgi:asparagine synthase (glutamine-hydrolysing)
MTYRFIKLLIFNNLIMCGINGIYNLSNNEIDIKKNLLKMNKILKHRGPDGDNVWVNDNIGLGHVRLSIIDLTYNASQPMTINNLTITFNGEIYNYKLLKNELYNEWKFNTNSDTEVILALYSKYGENCVDYLVGMFSFVIWDNINNKLFCARDRFGIKPFYYFYQDEIFYFASEVKALLPFLNKIEEDIDGITEYLIFQYPISDNIMVKNIKQLLPAHKITVQNKTININRYWELDYNNKIELSEQEYCNKLKELIDESIKLHLISDVPISSYISGGLDSSIISLLASNNIKLNNLFHGNFVEYPNCDESYYAKIIADKTNTNMETININYNDFKDNIKKIIYYLDYPIAGPGSFCQYMVSLLASKYTKVILGGQGGDEIFCGYVRYLIPHLERSLNNSFEGNNLDLLNLINHMGIFKEYKPMVKHFFSDGMFKNLDERYFHLINRTNELNDIINWDFLTKDKTYDLYKKKFNNKNIPNNDFFNKMLNFDLEYSLPGLLHVEDRVSMACGIESRVPFINHNIIQFVSKIPENIKINCGETKYLLKKTYNELLPNEIINRKDKMGFPVPLNEWFKSELKDFFIDTMKSLKKRNIKYLNIDDNFINNINTNLIFNRKYWILFSLELWYQNFFDNIL